LTTQLQLPLDANNETIGSIEKKIENLMRNLTVICLTSCHTFMNNSPLVANFHFHLANAVTSSKKKSKAVPLPSCRSQGGEEI
jgi:hypothetical protein